MVDLFLQSILFGVFGVVDMIAMLKGLILILCFLYEQNGLLAWRVLLIRLGVDILISTYNIYIQAAGNPIKAYLCMECRSQ